MPNKSSEKKKKTSLDRSNPSMNSSRQSKSKTKPPPSKSRPNSVSSNKSSSKSSSCSAAHYSSMKADKSKSRSIGLRKPCSISSMASQYHMTTGRFQPNPSATNDVVSQSIGDQQFTQFGQDNLFDAVVAYLYCPIHRKVALSSVDKKGQFLPFSPINVGQSWQTALANLLHKVLQTDKQKSKPGHASPPLYQCTIVDILRVQLPIYYEYICRVLYRVDLSPAGCSTGLCADNDVIAWFEVQRLHNPAVVLFGPEPTMIEALTVCQGTGGGAQCREVTLFDVLLQATDSGRPLKDRLLESAAYTEDDIVRLYADYLQHTYPSEFMTPITFGTYLTRTALKLARGPGEMLAVFRSFCHNVFAAGAYINFEELITGLAAVDKLNGTTAMPDSSSEPDEEETTKQVDSKQQTKSKSSAQKTVEPPPDPSTTLYVFRYFAKSSTSIELTEQEFARMLTQFRVPSLAFSKLVKPRFANGPVSPKTFVEMFTDLWPQLVETPARPEWSIFGAAVVGGSPLGHLRLHCGYPPLNLKTVARHKTRLNQAALTGHNRLGRMCERCRKTYHLSTYMVKMAASGMITEPVENELTDAGRADKKKRTLSTHHFTEQFVCNQLVNSVRKFAANLKIYELTMRFDTSDWTRDRAKLADKILLVCKEATSLMRSGPTVLTVSSPVYVIGDIHGNLRDLLIYEKQLWKLGPYLSAANFLFLGDYVDRGVWGLECIVYLLCLKLLAPDRMFMLRGNHESREMQRQYSFYNECLAKFTPVGGAKLGERIFEALNQVFDMMPLCAVVDGTIYCAHGGIPSCASKIELIYALQRPLKDPDNDSQVSLEILWNDPIHDQEYADLATNEDQCKQSTTKLPYGYLTNLKRGTGCYYSEAAMAAYMDANSLSHLIRAHEVIPKGFQYHCGGRCVTVFSCSFYQEGINEAAVAFVHDSKIRVIKVDTGKKEDAKAGQ